MLKQEKKETIKQKLNKAFFFWFYFDPVSLHHFQDSQKKALTKVVLKTKIKYLKKFFIHFSDRLLNNNQQKKQKELFLLKQFLTHLDIQENSIKQLDVYNLKRFRKTHGLSSKKEKQESKYLQSLYCLEDFLSV